MIRTPISSSLSLNLPWCRILFLSSQVCQCVIVRVDLLVSLQEANHVIKHTNDAASLACFDQIFSSGQVTDTLFSAHRCTSGWFSFGHPSVLFPLSVSLKDNVGDIDTDLWHSGCVTGRIASESCAVLRWPVSWFWSVVPVLAWFAI